MKFLKRGEALFTALAYSDEGPDRAALWRRIRFAAHNGPTGHVHKFYSREVSCRVKFLGLFSQKRASRKQRNEIMSRGSLNQVQ
jgi:hypothetical protein